MPLLTISWVIGKFLSNSLRNFHDQLQPRNKTIITLPLLRAAAAFPSLHRYQHFRAHTRVPQQHLLRHVLAKNLISQPVPTLKRPHQQPNLAIMPAIKMNANTATSRLGEGRHINEVLYELRLSKEFFLEVSETQATFDKNWESFNQQGVLGIIDFARLLNSGAGLLSYLEDFMNEHKDSEKTESSCLYLSETKGIFFTSKFGEGKYAESRFVNVSIRDIYRDSQANLRGVSTGSVSFRSNELELFCNKIPEIIKSFRSHYQRFHAIHSKNGEAAKDCDFCQAMTNTTLGPKAANVFCPINLFKPKRSVVTKSPISSNKPAAEVPPFPVEGDDKDGKDDGRLDSQTLFDAVWGPLERFMQGNCQGSLILFLRGRAIAVHPNDVTRNHTIGRKRLIPTPTLPSIAEHGGVAAPAAAAVAASAASSTNANAASATQQSVNKRKATRPQKLSVEARSLLDMEALEIDDDDDGDDNDNAKDGLNVKGLFRKRHVKSAVKKTTSSGGQTNNNNNNNDDDNDDDQWEDDDDYDEEDAAFIDDSAVNSQAEAAAQKMRLLSTKAGPSYWNEGNGKRALATSLSKLLKSKKPETLASQTTTGSLDVDIAECRRQVDNTMGKRSDDVDDIFISDDDMDEQLGNVDVDDDEPPAKKRKLDVDMRKQDVDMRIEASQQME